MKYLIAIFVFLASLQSVATTFSLEVVYPDKEKKEFMVHDAPQEVNLGKTKWNCSISKLFEKDGFNYKAVHCKGPQKMTASIGASCKPNSMDSALLSLEDDKKFFQISLSCKP